MGRPERHVTMLDIYLLSLLYLYVSPWTFRMKDNVRAKLQALVYDILPSGKRCSEFVSEHIDWWGKKVIIKMACVSEDLKC